MRAPTILIFAIVLTIAGQTLADSWFSDNFNDGAINTTNWSYGGGGISQSGGVLNLDRNNAEEDYIKTAHTYSGNFVVELDIRLNYINWNDPFHGITIADSLVQDGLGFTGISLGFSYYDKLYCCHHEVRSSINEFGSVGTNLTSQWQHWTLTKSGNNLSILVNGLPVYAPGHPNPFGGTVPDTVSIYLPGYHHYNFGGGDGIGITSSTVDNFSITPVPEPATLLLLGLGAAMAIKRRKNS
jgi:hypothetical protein